MRNKYTLELNYLLGSSNFELFDFDYDFYEPQLKEQFEQKFKDYYFFNEIGFETIARFKHFLRTRLNTIAPYYRQLYETELKSKDINFLLNKDLRESFVREIIKEGSQEDTINGTSSSKGSAKLLTENEYKESNLDNGIADLTDDKITNVNSTKDNNSQDTTQDSKSNTVVTKNNDDKESEKTELISQGNIGITSSAELLRDWRQVLLNIDMLIIDECRDLFMQIF